MGNLTSAPQGNTVQMGSSLHHKWMKYKYALQAENRTLSADISKNSPKAMKLNARHSVAEKHVH